MVPPTPPAPGWPSTPADPKWGYPCLDLAISLPRAEGEKNVDAPTTTVEDGWTPPDPPIHTPHFWGSDDKDPPPSAGTTLAA